MVSADANMAARDADRRRNRWTDAHPGGQVVAAPPAAEWPFRYPPVPPLPAGAVLVRVDALHEAFVNHQRGATRLVTTQATYTAEVWLQALAAHGGAQVLATADPDALRTHAPEVLERRGPWGDIDVVMLGADGATGAYGALGAGGADQAAALLARAFRVDDSGERLRRCVEALALGRTPPALVAAASACMEVHDLATAARDLDEALALAPEWPAAHFERGKLWLRTDDMARASESFRATVDRLPGFESAWANLGATLGELDRPDEALAAFERALARDPKSHQALNNVGVVQRELSRLSHSEAAFRTVIQLAPNLAVGHYNLGHTLFLQGRYQAALSAYAEGQARDPERNPVQASRLALCRVATGDAAGALNELERATGPLSGEYRRQLLADTSAILWAVITAQPALQGWQPVHEWLTRELARPV